MLAGADADGPLHSASMVPLRYGSARSLHCATNAAVRGGRCHCRRAHLQRSRRHARYCTASQAPIHSSVDCLHHHPWCRCVRNCCSDLRPQRTHRVARQTSELRKIGGHTVCLTPSCPLLSRAAARSWPLPTLNKQHGAAFARARCCPIIGASKPRGARMGQAIDGRVLNGPVRSVTRMGQMIGSCPPTRLT